MLRALGVATLGAALMLHAGCAGGERKRSDASGSTVTTHDAAPGSDVAEAGQDAGDIDAQIEVDGRAAMSADAAMHDARLEGAVDAAPASTQTSPRPRRRAPTGTRSMAVSTSTIG